jgi:hypothetical protein
MHVQKYHNETIHIVQLKGTNKNSVKDIKKRNSKAGNMVKPLHIKLKALTSNPKSIKKEM